MRGIKTLLLSSRMHLCLPSPMLLAHCFCPCATSAGEGEVSDAVHWDARDQDTDLSSPVHCCRLHSATAGEGEVPDAVGWEANNDGKLLPRLEPGARGCRTRDVRKGGGRVRGCRMTDRGCGGGAVGMGCKMKCSSAPTLGRMIFLLRCPSTRRGGVGWAPCSPFPHRHTRALCTNDPNPGAAAAAALRPTRTPHHSRPHTAPTPTPPPLAGRLTCRR